MIMIPELDNTELLNLPKSFKPLAVGYPIDELKERPTRHKNIATNRIMQYKFCLKTVLLPEKILDVFSIQYQVRIRV